jgi:hypothetical protein
VNVRALRNLRRRRGWRIDIAGWDGSLPPPHAVKARAVWTHGAGKRVLVETGTYHGAMIDAVRPGFQQIISIELDDRLYEAAVEKYAADPGVTILHGDSATALPDVVSELEEPAVFWLDGHYSGEGTAWSEPPAVAELEAVLGSDVDHVVLIDDAADFGSGGYPTLGELRSLVGGLRPTYCFEVEDNVIRARPSA